jgi:hypothetical protein
MKAWLWHHLYPMNLWSRCVVYSGSLIKLYNKWIWKLFLENRLSSSLEVAADEFSQPTRHICVQCRREVKLALVDCDGPVINLFCSAECKDKWLYSGGLEKDSESRQQPSI